MKAVLILATAFIFISMLMNGARRRGKLNEQANRAVTGLASGDETIIAEFKSRCYDC